MNSVDFEARVMDDLFLTFLDTDTSSKIEITIPYHVAQKLVDKLYELVDIEYFDKLTELELENADLKGELKELEEINQNLRQRKFI